MVYARYSTGFKAGGANSRSTNYTAFGPEEVTAYELGFKSQFWDNRARLNLAVFDSTIAHKQMDFSLPFDPNSGETRTTMVTTNALSDGKSRGAELEFNVMPVDNLTLGLNYAYTKIDAQTATDPFGAGVQVTVQLLLAPKNGQPVGRLPGAVRELLGTEVPCGRQLVRWLLHQRVRPDADRQLVRGERTGGAGGCAGQQHRHHHVVLAVGTQPAR
jgi:outer membrane receptor protein involved in Fe transport